MIKLMNTHKPAHSVIELTPSLLIRAFIITLLVLPLNATAGIYKWVDEEGKVHYGGQRPENQIAEKLKIDVPKKATAKDPADKDKPVADENAESETSEEESKEDVAQPEEPEKPKISRAEKKRVCGLSRARLAKIESRGRMKTSGKEGEVRYLTDAERNGRLKKARSDIKKYCR